MNSKKILALLCSATIASSTLVPVMASADETAKLSEATVLWSDTFDAYQNETYGNGGLAEVLTLAASVVGGETYEAIAGATLTVCTRGGGDDTSYFLTEAVEEGSTDLALKTTVSRFSTQSRGSKIEFGEAYSAASEELPLVIYSRVKMDVIDSNVYAPAFRIGDVVITKDLLYTEADNEWVDLKVISYADGTYEVDVNGNVVTSGSTTTAFSSINFSALDATGSVISGDPSKCDEGYHTIWLDDMVIYHTDDVVAPAPEAATQGPETTPPPEATPVPVSAPAAEVPAKAKKVVEQNFDALENVSYSLGTEGTNVALGDVDLIIGARASGADTSTYASVTENVEADKMLKVVNGKFGNSGRAVRLELGKEVKTSELGEGAYAALTFAAKLNPTDTYPATVNFYKDATTDGKTYLYTNVIATITTDEAATDGSIIVTPGEWHLVEYFMFPDGTIELVVDGTSYSISGTHTALPLIGTYNGTAATYTGVDFDNIVAYVEGEYTAEIAEEIPTVEPFPGTTVAFTQDMSALASNYAKYLGTEGATYTDIEGLSYTIGGRSEGISGDSTSVRVETDDYANQYLRVTTSRFGTNGRAPLFQATGAPVLEQLATDEDFVTMSFAAKLIPSADGANPATLAFPVVADYSTNGGYYIYNAATITTDETSTTAYIVPADTWFLVDVIVYKTGDYQILVDGSEAATGKEVGSGGGGSDKKVLAALPYFTTNAANKEATNASFAIDNVVVGYTGEISPLETPDPTLAPVSAPAVDADSNTTIVFAEGFNGLEDSFTRMAEESATVEVGANLKAVLGGRTGESSNEPQYTAVSVKSNVDADKVMNLTGGKFGTATRAAKVAVNSPSVADMENDDDYIAMGFAFKLNSVANVTDQISAITLVANADDVAAVEGNTETKDDGNVYGYALATITTNEADAADGKVKAVTADEWHTAYVYVYKDFWYVYVDDEEVASGETVNYSNSDKVSVTKLPQIVAAKNVKAVTTYSNVDIDNMVVYTSAVPTLANVEITAATADTATITADVDTTAKVIVAKYADGRMVSATTQVVNLTAGENTVTIAAEAGDKVMAWTAYNNQGVQPYCAAVTVQ